MNAVILVQQRMGSTRFPGKAKALLGGKTITEHVVRRGLATGHPVVLAVPGADDFTWARWGLRHGYLFQYPGDEDDVLGRLWEAALTYVPRPDIVVRLTGDCPFVPVQGISLVIAAIETGKMDYAETRSDPSTRPNGIDVQAFTFGVLMKASLSKEYREHVTGALVKAATGIGIVDTIEDITLDDLPPFRITVDTEEDLERLNALEPFLTFKPETGQPSFESIVHLFNESPHFFHLDTE